MSRTRSCLVPVGPEPALGLASGETRGPSSPLPYLVPVGPEPALGLAFGETRGALLVCLQSPGQKLPNVGDRLLGDRRVDGGSRFEKSVDRSGKHNDVSAEYERR